MALNRTGDKALDLPVHDGLYPLTALDAPEQNIHNDFEAQKDPSIGFFVMVSGTEPICLSVFPTLHTFAHYRMDEKKMLSELLRLEGVTIPALSFLVAHGYL